MASLVGLAQTAAARWLVLAGASVSMPVGTSALQEGVSSGFGATCGAGARLGPVELVGRFTYTGFSRDDVGVSLTSGLASRPVNVLRMTGGAMTTYDVVLDVRFFPAQTRTEVTQPFLLAAAGISSYDYESVQIEYQYAGHTWSENVAAEGGTGASFALGAGARFAANRRWSVVLEGRYEQVPRRGEDLRSAHVRLEMNLGL